MQSRGFDALRRWLLGRWCYWLLLLLLLKMQFKVALHLYSGCSFLLFRRQLSNVIKGKKAVSLAIRSDTAKQFDDDGVKHRRHPGLRHNPCHELPYKLQLAAYNIINKYRSKRFRADVERIKREFLEVMVQLPDSVQNQDNKNSNHVKKDQTITTDEDFVYTLSKAQVQRNQEKETQEFRKQAFYQRKPYSNYECAAYMTTRLPANYAAIRYIFNEITHEEPSFTPTNLFDFGSGPGTVIWAADEHWRGSLKEVFAVDLNENMNDLSRELLSRGASYSEDISNNIFYRQFLPVKHQPQYDLVVSAFSLLDFPDTKSRIYVVENLWRKTSGMLVLVEHGSKAGFTAIMEARNFVLQISKKQLDPLQIKETSEAEELEHKVSRTITKPEGSVVAPCPHDLACPRQSSLQKKSYCNFAAKYNCFNYGQAEPGVRSEKFAYVVLKKNNTTSTVDQNWTGWSEEQKHWPRVVQPVLKKSGHTICTICTASGCLNEVILTKQKNDHHIYKVVRRSDWGDKLPAQVIPPTEPTHYTEQHTTTEPIHKKEEQ